MYRLYLIIFFFFISNGMRGGVPHSSAAPLFGWKSSSVLASGKWVKIKTPGRGIYKIPYDKLKSWGFSAPELVNVYGGSGYKLPEPVDADPMDDLVKNRTWRGKDASGKDCLFFYSTGTVAWKWDRFLKIFRHTGNPYSDDSFYYLSQEGNQAHSVTMAPPVTQATNIQVTSFDDFVRYEKEQYNVIRSGQQWFGEKFVNGTSRTFSFTCDNPVPDKNATLLINAVGRSSSSSALEVTINQSKQTPIPFLAVNVEDATTLFGDEKQRTFNVLLPTATEVLSLTYTASNSLSEAYLDYITINWRRRLSMKGDELYFRDTESVAFGNIAQFSIESGTGLKVFDITDPSSLVEIPVSEQGSLLTFRQSSGILREYMAFRPAGNFPEPVLVGPVANQDLHAMSIPELIIIVHPDFMEQAVQVADFHRENDAMEVKVVTTNEIYNEFGSGSPDASSIRNFLRMCHNKSSKLKYVLLYGDGSYDNRNLTGVKKAFIPTYQSENSLLPTSSFVSDDYFVILEPGESIFSGDMDLGIGRLPVSSKYEAQIVAGKIIDYYSPEAMGLWRNNLCFIGDDEDSNLHMSDSETLANQVNSAHRAFQTNKVYFDAYPQQVTTGGERYPGVTEAINQQVKKGVLILNYVGHANDRFLSDERVLDISTINSWTNRNNLPIFVTATCEFSRFDAGETSAGESILLNPNGGGIGLFSTSRVVYAYSNFLLSKSFYQYAFEKDADGQNYRMGDIMRLAKNNTQSTLNSRNFTLLADPALRLSYPRYNVVTNSINQKDAGMLTDTLKALAKVTVSGEVTGHNGQRITSFNGQISAVVYDKAVMQKTLGNGGDTPFTYKVQNNIIYRGEATVNNGTFSFSFVIPKDISYNLGNGKILYYAQNGTTDAHGAYENFIIGGSDASQATDMKGPEVNVYLDNTTFIDGGKTSQNPLLLADIFDENGINTVGAGIGHDIVAVLDGDYANAIVLNDYYLAAKDDYTRGTIEFPLRNLPEGEHFLLLKVWDSANNSTEVMIRFVVTGDFYMDKIGNYPNPVTTFTDFTFSHNQPDATFKALLEIFDIAGNRIDQLQTNVTSEGENSNPVRWNPDERGLNLRSGMYLYRITLLSQQGKVTSKAGKMIVSR